MKNKPLSAKQKEIEMDPKRASRFMGDGYTCAESVLLAVSQEFEIKDELPTHMAMCFGGGIGLTGAVCGAVSGAVMAIGLIRGPAADMKEFFQIMPLAQELRRRFEEEMKTINCRDLTGFDLTTPEKFQQYMDTDTPETVCVPAVDTAYRLVMEILKDAE